MNALFPIEHRYPPGFSYTPDFINREEEQVLLKEISRIELHSFLFQGYEARRRVASFGYDYSFEKRTLSKGREIPAAFHWLIVQVARCTDLQPESFAELLVTEYPVGAVINWHRDAAPFGLIAGISLSADCTFRLRPQEKGKQTRSSIVSLPIARRSLYIIAGEARVAWQHSTLPVKAVRHSITFRTLKADQQH